MAEGPSLFKACNFCWQYRISLYLLHVFMLMVPWTEQIQQRAHTPVATLPFGELISAPHFPHSILHVCVSQCIDERVEHGGNHGVKQGKNCVVTDRISHGDIGEVGGKKKKNTMVTWEPQVERALW